MAYRKIAALLASCALLMTAALPMAAAADEAADPQGFVQSFEEPFGVDEGKGAIGGGGADVVRPALYTAKDENDPNVRTGTHSIQYAGLGVNSGTYALSIHDVNHQSVQIGERYYVSYWIKVKDVTADAGNLARVYNGLYHISQWNDAWSYGGTQAAMTLEIAKDGTAKGSLGFVSISDPDDKGWRQVIFDITAEKNCFAIFMNGDCEFYIDDVEVKPFPSGVMGDASETSYCEEFYNVIDSSKVKEMVSAKGGTKQVLEIPLEKRVSYIFGLTQKNASDGSQSKVYLTNDPAGTDILKSEDGTQQALFTSSGKDWKRSAIGIMTDSTPTLYLVIENPTGEDCIQNVMMFEEKFAYAEDPNVEDKYVPVNYDKLPEHNDGTPNGGTPVDPGDPDGPTNPDDDIPATGEGMIAVTVSAVLLILSGAAIWFFRARRKEVQS